MRKVFIIVVTLILLIFPTASCGGSINTIPDDTKWFLRLYVEENLPISIIDGTEITATFDSTEGRINGSAGCNTYFAEYKAEGGRLSISEMGYTERECLSPEGIMGQEQLFLSILRDALSFEAYDTTLTIFCSGGQQLYFTTASR